MAGTGSIGTAYFKVAPDMSGVQGKIAGGLRGTGSAFAEQFGGEVSGKSAFIVGAIAGIASAATSKAMSILTGSIDTAVKRVDTLNSAQKTFQYMGFAASDSAAAVKAVTASIQGLPTPLDGAIRGMTSLAATYGDVKLGQKVFTALNDAILGFGGSADMVSNAIQQVSQLPLDGPLDAQTWNSLRNSGLTPVLVAMGKDMGKSVSQLKSDFGDGTLKVQDFVNELTKLDTQGGGGLVKLSDIAHNATSGISTGFANMQTAVARGLANIIQAVGQKNISNAIAAIGAAFEKVLNIVAKSIPVVIGYIKGFFDYVNQNKDIFYPIAVGVAAAAAAFLIWKSAVSAWSVVTKAGIAIQAAFDAVLAANPIGVIALAVIGLTAALAYFFRNTATGQKIFATFSKIVTDIGIGLRLLFDTFTGGDPTLKASEGRFAGIAKVLSTLSGILREVFGFVGKQLSSAFKSLNSIFDQLKPTILSIAHSLGEFLKNKTVITVLKAIGVALLVLAAAPVVIFIATVVASITIMSKVLGFLAKHIAVVKALLAVLFAPVLIPIALAVGAFLLLKATVEVLVNVFVSVFNAIKTVVVTVFNAIAAVWNSVLSPVLNVMITIIQTIFSIYTKIWAAIALVVVGTLFIIGGIIANVMQAIWGVISSVWNAVYGVISSVIGFITGVIVNAWNFYYGIISSVLGMIWGVITTVWNAIYGFLSGVFSTIWGVVSGAWNRIYGTISGFVGNIWNSVTGTFNSVVNFVSGIGGRILGAIGNFGGLLYNAGRDMINGLLNGAGSLLSTIGSFFLSKLPGWIQGPFKKALGIHSPSKVFAGFGSNISQGLADGVAANASAVTGAISDLADNAMSSFGSNGLTADIAANANPAPASPYSSAQGGNNTHQEVTIGQVVLGDQSAVKEWWAQLNQDTMRVGMGLTPVQGAQQ